MPRFPTAACLLLLHSSAATGEPALPSYEQALDAFQTERAAIGGPKLSAEDWALMEQAGADLAAAMPNPGLQVGDRAPRFELPNARGETVSLSALLAQGPVV